MSDKSEAVRRMQKYIDSCPDEKITPAGLAKAAYFSPWYSARLFKELTGLTPADYARRLRLSRSALRLRDGGVKVIDAALDAGFGSADGYSRAFRREFGCGPRQYAKNPTPLYLFVPYAVEDEEEKEKVMEKVKTVFVQQIRKPARKAVILRGKKAEDYFSYCEEVGCDVWGLLVSMKSLCGEPVCLWLPEKLKKPGTSTYVQGVEAPADFSGPVPDGFDVIDLPEADYLMFVGEPFAEEDYCRAINDVWEAIKKYDPALIGRAWDDSNPRIQLEPIGKRGYIELLAIK